MKSTNLRAMAMAATLAATFPLLSQTLPNTVKYKDTGLPNATGRSGSATLEARALLGRDGTTDIELTTGSFENGGSTGTIAKVQLKAGGSAENFNDLQNDGTASIAVDGLAWHQTVQIQTNVRDRSDRTEVITVDEIVKRRPDLAVTSISAPAQVSANVPVTIYATVVELNGDVGARADALLLVDGTEVDRAEFIWVDASGNVSVAFTHAFRSYGNVNLQVVLSGLNPGDWDDANNSATRPLEVAESLDNWAVYAHERTSTTVQRSESPQWDINSQEFQRTQITSFWGWIQHPANMAGYTLSTSASTDGRTLYDVSNLQGPNASASCQDLRYWEPRITVCGSSSDDGFVLFEVHWSASDVVFRSWGYDYSRHPFFPERPPRGVFDVTSGYSQIRSPLGNTVQWDLRFTDGDGVVYHSQPFLASLQSGEWHMNNPRRCGFSRFYGFQICTTYRQDTYWREGRASQ